MTYTATDLVFTGAYAQFSGTWVAEQSATGCTYYATQGGNATMALSYRHSDLTVLLFVDYTTTPATTVTYTEVTPAGTYCCNTLVPHFGAGIAPASGTYPDAITLIPGGCDDPPPVRCPAQLTAIPSCGDHTPVTVTCCDNGIPPILYLTFSGAGGTCPAFAQTYMLEYDASTGHWSWHGTVDGHAIQWFTYCPTGQSHCGDFALHLIGCGFEQVFAGQAGCGCSPLYLQFLFNGSEIGTCCPTGNYTMTITE